jgi:hypothetical protein
VLSVLCWLREISLLRLKFEVDVLVSDGPLLPGLVTPVTKDDTRVRVGRMDTAELYKLVEKRGTSDLDVLTRC